MQHAAIYVRISSETQALNASLDTQESACRAYASDLGLDVVAVLRETWSGVEYFDRPAMSELRRMMREREIGHVVFYVVDRVSRGGIYAALLHEEARDAGVQLYAAHSRWVVPMTDAGELLMYIDGWQGKGEWRQLRERTTRGKRARVKSGKLLPAGKPLYGYRWRDDTKAALDVDPLTAATVARIYGWLLTGETIRGIARRLADEGIPTPTGVSPHWGYETIRNILRNPAYKGDAYGWGLKRSGNGVGQTFDASRAIALPAGTIPPLVDAATWDAAQRILERNKAAAIRNAREPEAVLLRGGYARCGYCGRTMTARPRADGRYDYVCGATKDLAPSCPRPTIVAHRLDALVWERVRALVLRDDVIADEVTRLATSDPTDDDRRAITRGLAELDRQRDNLVRAIGLTDDPEASAALVTQLGELTPRRKALQLEQAALEGRRAAWQASQELLAGLDAWRTRVAANIDTLDWRERRQLLDLLQVRALVWRADHDPRARVITTLDPNLLPDCDQYDKWYCGLAVFGTLGVARLKGINGA